MKKKSTSQSAFFNLRIVIAALFCLIGVAVALLGMGAFSSVFAQAKTNQASPGTQMPDVVRMVGPVRLDQDLRNLPYVAPKPEHEERRLMRYPHLGTGQTSAPSGQGISGLKYVQALLKNVWRPAPTMPGPLLTFEGQGNTCGCQPSDSEGDVGPNHYIEAINEVIAIYNKNGVLLSGPTGYNSFFSGLTGTPCANANDGDPYVIYDQVADRWMISDFAFPSFPGNSFYQCIAVSQTSDPVSGGWFLYALQVDPGNPTYLGDYPKFALWDTGGSPDQNAYFLTMNLFTNNTTFNGVRAYALDRASMLTGGPANAIGFTLSATDVGASYSFVAATGRPFGDPPPAGRNEMVLAIDSPATGGVPLTQVHARFFHVDFVTPANSVFGLGPTHLPNAEITVSPFVDAFTDTTSDLVPQLGTTGKLDTLGDKIMTPVVYQNHGGTESLWADQTVIENYPNGPTAVRWYQFDVTGGNFPAMPVQQQSWDNAGDGLWRWMPSIAVDQSGNTVMGYSTSSTTIFPSIRYAGRLAADPPGNLAQGEGIMFAGVSQFGGFRWGDYTRTEVDPSNGMDFWHINQYAQASNWHTRIGKFNFVGVGSPTPTATASPIGTATATPTGTPAQCSWSAGPDMPTALVRAVGVYFPDGNFYTMGGRTADTAGSDFQHVLKYSPASNTWTQMASTLPDNQMNNMACGVLSLGGTPYIYCVGGSAAGQTTAAARVFYYNPANDTVTTLTSGDNWPGNAAGTILPGGFAETNNKMYILGGFNINVASTNQIWQFDPTAGIGSKWTQMVNTPEGIMYAPTCAINGIIYVGGASDYQGGTVVDTTNSFSFNPVTNMTGAIAPIPRATGETRGLNFCNRMYVIGGGRVTPNPSTEVDVYDPVINMWSLGMPFSTARRNFPTDTDGTNRIWLSGGYDSSGITPLASMEIFNCPVSPCGVASPTPTATAIATATATPVVSATPTATAIASPTATATATSTPTPTSTPRTTPTPRPVPTPRVRPTPPPRP
jgi:N-acetylneuraminic acid mutarotase